MFESKMSFLTFMLLLILLLLKVIFHTIAYFSENAYNKKFELSFNALIKDKFKVL